MSSLINKGDIFTHPIPVDDVMRIIEQPLPWRLFENSTVLVTGATGMLPSYVLSVLVHLNDAYGLGVKIIALAHSEDTAVARLSSVLGREDLQLIVGDVADTSLSGLRIDYVIHGASPAQPRQHLEHPTATLRPNIVGTIKLLDHLHQQGNGAFLLLSSSEVYGLQTQTNRLTEKDFGGLDPFSARASYSEGKRAAECLIAAYRYEYSMHAMAARLSHIYGPGMQYGDQRVQAEFARAVLAKHDIQLSSAGRDERSYTYVADAVSGLFWIFLLGKDGVYNIASPDGWVSIRELAEAFVNARPMLHLRIATCQTQTNHEPRQLGLDESKLRTIGWKPMFSLSEGITRTLSFLDDTTSQDLR